MPFSVESVRTDFPILSTQVQGKPLAYLDNAATTQLPEPVLDAVSAHHRTDHANIHRGIHTLSQRSTAKVEAVRAQAQRFLGAEHPEEIIFTSGTTQGIHLIAAALGAAGLGPGDEILVTRMEHHSNFVPWQQLCQRTGAVMKVIPLTQTGDLDLDALAGMLSPRVRLAAVTWVSNVLGTVNPVAEVVRMAHEAGAWVLVDGAQCIRHVPVDVSALGCEFFVSSGHKMMAPTGVGLLYGKRAILEQLPAVVFGGGMVDTVMDDATDFAQLPFKFEAGTVNISGIVGLGAAMTYLTGLGRSAAAQYEQELLRRAEEGLSAFPRVRLLGSPARRAGCLTFLIDGTHYFDVAALLDRLGVAVRSGHHCAQPLFRSMGLSGGVRVSPAFYNTSEEIDRLLQGVERVISVLVR